MEKWRKHWDIIDSWDNWDSSTKRGGTYPLVNNGKLTVCELENGHRNSGFSQ